MPKMLRQKGTGDLFIWTPKLAELPEMELVVEDPVKVILEELGVDSLPEDFKEVKATPLAETKVEEVT